MPTLRATLLLTGIAALHLVTAGCQTPAAGNGGIGPKDYNDIQRPGDTFQMFRHAIRDKEYRAAHRLLSKRLRSNHVSYSEFSLFMKSSKSKPYKDRLASAEYVRAYYTNPEHTEAVMIIQSGELVREFPMVYEPGHWYDTGEWHIDWQVEDI